MKKYLLPSFLVLIIMTVATGVLYPLAVTLTASLIFPQKSQGIRLQRDERGGFLLVGQKFSSPRYFWGRPSAGDYNAGSSGGSNLGALNDKLRLAVMARAKALAGQEPTPELIQQIPADLLFSSASGLDPHISPAGARYQIDRILKARNLPPDAGARLIKIINDHTEPPTLGFLGQNRVNVLSLNLDLDSLP